MGRELIVGKLDKLDNNTYIINLDEDDDNYICGRDEFTNELANMFYNSDTYTLIVVPKAIKDKVNLNNYIFKFKEDSESLEYTPKIITLEIVKAICEQYMIVEQKEFHKLDEVLDSAKQARNNTSKLKDFLEFSEYIQELQQEADSWCFKANQFNRILSKYVCWVYDTYIPDSLDITGFPVIVLSE